MKVPVDADTLRGAVKQIRQMSGYLERLLPMDADDVNRPESERLGYITRSRTFGEGFVARERKKKGAKP
jgi:hypothetical protein